MSENEKLEQAAAEQASGSREAREGREEEGRQAGQEAKPGFFARLGKWFQEMKSELKKVQWPTAKQTANNTVIVIVCVHRGWHLHLGVRPAGRRHHRALLALFGKG